ncbi:hypothetical protein RJ640_000384 [Escallonia rubra]|uniref:Uncharacterized protein n=1 Tax=Escallonia rubra TaxID=112253 RepID=A0AA88RP45_9ASTE|nr:hypothetical protein RJ640_000384 [Escallonia rubra]
MVPSGAANFATTPRWQVCDGLLLFAGGGLIGTIKARRVASSLSALVVKPASLDGVDGVLFVGLEAYAAARTWTNMKPGPQGEADERRASELKEDVKMMLENMEDSLSKLELVDTIERLGVCYHFEKEIRRILESIYNKYKTDQWRDKDLYGTALGFRLFRQHGYRAPEDVFMKFKDGSGSFKACLCEDIEGLLCLYEASYLSMEGETILDEARDFTTKALKEALKTGTHQDLATLVNHALDQPLHWRVPRLEARWFIDAYEKRLDANPTLIELAKLDFNMVQAIYQEDLKHMSSWWKTTGLAENLSFARDRLMENFVWTVGYSYKPEFGYSRRISTKVNALITTIDDVYDVYGTLEELELFTSVIESWDVHQMEQLPDYMKICFLALYNFVNGMAYDIMKEQGPNIIPYLRKVWTDLCKAYLVEAKWYNSGYIPTLEEYMNNAWISISAPVMLTHCYFSSTDCITEEALECLEKCPNIIRWPAVILRLTDDLATSSDELKRGDIPKSIQCYMHETGASEEAAREHVKHLISETWKKMNNDLAAVDSPFSRDFLETAVNVNRMALCVYGHGDGHAGQDSRSRSRVSTLLTDPIPS